MKNLLDPETRRDLLARFERLAPGTPARWGRMNVEQMVCHVADPVRIALGDLPARDHSTFFRRHVLKRLVLAGMPAPKGKVPTFPEIDQARGGGTPPTTLDEDRRTLGRLVERFVAEAPQDALRPSPGFGRLSGREYGRLMYAHMHHHLKQFGA